MGVNDFEGSDGGPLPTKTANLRMPKVVRWNPCSDITAYELSLSMEVLIGMAMGVAFLEDNIANLPEAVQRHFDVSEHPVFK